MHGLQGRGTASDRTDVDVVVSEEFNDRGTLDAIVLDDEQALGAIRREFLEPVKRQLQAIRGRRLHDVVERAVRQPVLPLFVQRDDLDRYVPRRGVNLELVEHRPAESSRASRDSGQKLPIWGPNTSNTLDAKRRISSLSVLQAK